MRRFVTAGALALFVALVAGCDDQASQTPSEPQFGKVSNQCTDPLLTELTEIHGDIEAVFNGKQAKRGAHQIVDNIGRKVCQDPPNYDATPVMAEGFYRHVLNEPWEEYNGGMVAAIALVERVFAFALGTGPTTIPPEAFEDDGGVGVVSPGVPDTIWTNNLEAAFIAEAGSFAGNDPVTIVLTRLSDPQPATPGYPIPGYQAYPEAYNFNANFPLDGYAEVWMCVVLDDLPVPFENLVIGHNDDGTGRLLTPALYEEYDGELLDCSGAAYQPVILGSAGVPGWLLLAGTVLEPVVSRILDVEPLNAMYFAGKGLGGRTGSLSPFAPVDPGIEYFGFSCGISAGNGSVYGNDLSTCFREDGVDINDGTGHGVGGAGLHLFPADTDVIVTASPGTGFALTSITGCDSGDGAVSDCVVTMNDDRSVTAAFEIVDTDYDLLVAGTYPVGAAFAGTIFGYYTDPYTPGTPDFECLIGSEIVDCAAAQIVPAGSVVRLTAVPDAGTVFDGWTLDCGAATGTDCWLLMLEDLSATANFGASSVATLTLTIPGRTRVTDGAAFTCDGGLGGNTCVYNYAPGVTITLDAIVWPDLQAELWLGGDCSEGQYARTCTTIMTDDQVIELRFDIPV